MLQLPTLYTLSLPCTCRSLWAWCVPRGPRARCPASDHGRWCPFHVGSSTRCRFQQRRICDEMRGDLMLPNIFTHTWEHVQILPAQLHGFSDTANRCLQTMTKGDSSQSFSKKAASARDAVERLCYIYRSYLCYSHKNSSDLEGTCKRSPKPDRSTHLLHNNKRRSRQVVRFLTCVCFGARSM